MNYETSNRKKHKTQDVKDCQTPTPFTSSLHHKSTSYFLTHFVCKKIMSRSLKIRSHCVREDERLVNEVFAPILIHPLNRLSHDINTSYMIFFRSVFHYHSKSIFWFIVREETDNPRIDIVFTYT